MGSSGRFKFSGITQKSNAASDAAQNKVVRMKTNAAIRRGPANVPGSSDGGNSRRLDLIVIIILRRCQNGMGRGQ